MLNGELRELSAPITVADLVTHLGLSPRRIAVEVNRDVIPREQYPTRALHEGDTIEIVHFIGGG